MENMEVLDEESLLRLTFAPEHFVDGEYQQSAISLEDLKIRGVSVDRTGLTKKEVVLERVASQAARRPDEREMPVYSLLRCSAVRDATNPAGDPFFDVEPARVRGNDGHALIFSKDRTLGKGGMRKVRDELLSQMTATLTTLELVYPDS
ncbi:hypothetical protein [Halopseudomonas maritima]|uniref:hypothetical protein n=1 Tax=Halopseudomonas maritima TaxID=2918528 RepID=UPI001EEA698A|nr:hypothetical protein [Halopseudomonas maritima]UJJ30246.1 hypothetical protein HV822_10600 [Halopseudomonas maritima]